MSIYTSFGSMEFDWYQGTLGDYVHLNVLVDDLLKHFDFSSVREKVRPQVNQYTQALDIYRGENTIVHLCWGGVNGNNIHFKSTGYDGQRMYDFLKKHKIEYSVSRADVRIDTVEKGLFEYLVDASTKFAHTHKIKTNTQGDWIKAIDGRTLYLGAKTSKAQVRIYEKGKQMGTDQEWTRLELQFRPQKAKGKKAASEWNCRDFWAASQWTKKYLEYVMIDKDGLPDNIKKISTWERSSLENRLIHLMTQYEKTLDEFSEKLPNGYDDIGKALKIYKEINQENKGARGGIGKSPYKQLITRLIG